VVEKGPPRGWTVDERDGDCHVILTRDVGGGGKDGGKGGAGAEESVEVSLLASDDNIEAIPLEGEGGEEEETMYEVPFTVNVIKQEGQVRPLYTESIRVTVILAVRACVYVE
jgi:hypothetical protein